MANSTMMLEEPDYTSARMPQTLKDAQKSPINERKAPKYNYRLESKKPPRQNDHRMDQNVGLIDTGFNNVLACKGSRLPHPDLQFSKNEDSPSRCQIRVSTN
jgi:hypothetical protein